MTVELRLFLKKMEGKWMSQQTVYYVNTKKFDTHISNISIDYLENKKIYNLNPGQPILHYINSRKNQLISYYFNQIPNMDLNIGHIEKSVNRKQQKYNFKLYSDNCMVIKTLNKNIECIEYLYIINQNLKISLVMLKVYSKYIALSFTSDIKAINS